MVGVPVIIKHKDLNKDNADDERVGVVNSVWYDEKDGWYWCDGIIWDETAQNLITDKNWSVSCSYDVKTANDEGGSENNIKYDVEFLDGVFTHLALVDNPRYERANIIFNSKTVIKNFNPNHGKDGKFCRGNGVNPNYLEELEQVIDKAKNNPNERQKLVIGKVTDTLVQFAKENGFDIEDYKHNLDVSGTRHAFKEHGSEKTEIPRGQIPITDDDFKKIPEVIYKYDEVEFTGKNKIGRETLTYKKVFDDGTIMYVEEIRNKQKTLTIDTMYKHKKTGNPRTFADNSNPLSNASIYIINDVESDFNPNVKESEINNSKENEMALIDELKKLITKVENDKEKDMDKEKIENEKVDKRKLIDEVGGILKGKVDEELIRTIIGKMEKMSYDNSESSADNEKDDDKKDVENCGKKVKNEEKEEPEKDKKEVKEIKEDVKEDVENKCKNSVDNSKPDYFAKLNEIYNSASSQIETKSDYVSRADREQAAIDYFTK